jgi:hypothetical protein
MAFNKEIIYKQALEVASHPSCYMIEDIIAGLPCGKTTFYDLFPNESDELNTLKEQLEQNKIKIKKDLRSKWYNGNNLTGQITLYKLLATKEEREAISMQQVNSSNEVFIKVVKVDE